MNKRIATCIGLAISWLVYATVGLAQVAPRAEKGDAIVRGSVPGALIPLSHAAIFVGYMESNEIDSDSTKWWLEFSVIQARGTGQASSFDTFDKATDPYRFMGGADDTKYTGCQASGCGPRNMHGKQDIWGSTAYMSRAVRDNIITEAKNLIGKSYTFVYLWSPAYDPTTRPSTRPTDVRCDGLMQWCYEWQYFKFQNRLSNYTPLDRGSWMTQASTSMPTPSVGVTSGTLGNNGWYTDTVTVTYSSADNAGSQGCYSGPEYVYLASESGYFKSPVARTYPSSGTYVTSTFAAFDFAGWAAIGPTLTIKVDKNNPSAPTSATETGGAQNNTWQRNISSPNFTWSGASDSHSGVAGYYWYFGTSSSGNPANWTSTAGCSPGSQSSGTYYLRVKTEDAAGNQSSAVTLFVFRYDGTTPSNPTSCAEDHGAANGVCQSTVADPSFTWSGASDSHSGVGGYYWYFGTSSTADPGTWTTTAGCDPSAVPSGTYYLRVKTADVAGNISSPITLFTFCYQSCTTLSTPTPTLPTCGSVASSTPVTVAWTDVSNESGYVVRAFSGGICAGSPIYTSSTLPANTTSYSLSGAGLSSGQTYSWQVQAKGNGTTYCDSGWSSCCSFNISGGCASYTLSSASTNFAAAGGSGSFKVYANTGCSWSAVPSTNWIQTSNSSSGTGTVTYTVSANTGAARTGTITVQDKVFTVQQSGTVTNGSRVAIVNPDHYRILKYGWRTDDYYYPIANGTVADNGSTTNVSSWTGLGTCADYLTTVLTNAGYQVDTYTGDTFPAATVSDYALVIVQDPMTEINRQFSTNVEDTAADLLQYTTNAVFLSRLDSYFSSGGSVILVGDAVRLLENGANRLNYGKVVLANNLANSVTSPSPVIPEHWLFIRGNPFCCHSRSGSATYTVAESALVPAGSVVSEVSLYDGRDMAWCHVWSDTIYSPSDAVSLLDVQIQGSGQYVLDGSVCNPTVYQDTVTTTAPSLMGYTLVNGRKVFFLGSDAFFDYQYNSLLGVWHCSASQGITSRITTNGVSAILGLVESAMSGVPSKPVTIDSISISNGVTGIGNGAIVVAGDAIGFAVTAHDRGSNPLNYQWNFGDGTTTPWSPLNMAAHVYSASNCGPYTASVTVTNGLTATSSNLTVAVACQLTITKLQAKLNFAKAHRDNCSLNATLDLGASFNPARKTMTLDLGDAQVSFTLDRKGRGVGYQGTCRLTYNKKRGVWTLTAKMRRGDWQTPWGAYGLLDADVTPLGVPVKFPVVVVVGDEAFAAEKSLMYKAKHGKSGNAKLIPRR